MIQIDELQIRMPGKNENDGTELGRRVAERLAEAMPEQRSNQHITELRIKFQSQGSDDMTGMADRIAEDIIRQIKMATL